MLTKFGSGCCSSSATDVRGTPHAHGYTHHGHAQTGTTDAACIRQSATHSNIHTRVHSPRAAPRLGETGGDDPAQSEEIELYPPRVTKVGHSRLAILDWRSRLAAAAGMGTGSWLVPTTIAARLLDRSAPHPSGAPFCLQEPSMAHNKLQTMEAS